MVAGVLIILGANYQGGKPDEKQMAQQSTVVIDRGGIPSSNQTNSKPSRVSNTRPISRISDQYSNNDNKRTGNTGNTLRSTTKPTEGRKQQSKPKPIINKPSAPQEPTKPPEQPSKPDREKPSPTPDPVYLLNVETPIAQVKAIPAKESLISISVGESNNGNKTKVDTSNADKDTAKNRIKTKVHHHTRNGQFEQRSKCRSSCQTPSKWKQQNRKLALQR